jgi:hypothetical protein
MHRLGIKISAILMVVAFIVSGLPGVSADVMQKGDDSSSLPPETITRVVYRYGPSGVTPVKISVQVEKGVNLEDTVLDKCAELAKNDTELQQFLNDSGLGITCTSFIKSRGRGFHVDFKLRIPVKRYFKKFPNLPPFYRMMKIPVVYCNYPTDPEAVSSIRSFGSGNTTYITGSHTVMAAGFFGYTTWAGFVAKRGFILRCGFAGFALVVRYS